MFFYENAPEISVSSKRFNAMEKDEFLSESILGDVLRDVYGTDDIIAQHKIGNLRADFLIKSKNVLVEFDGYRHYSSTDNVKRDISFARLAFENGYDFVRIPYFLQLPTVLPCYFGIDLNHNINHDNLYPDGFISKYALRPRDFCVAGVRRFVYEIDRLPTTIRENIYDTMNEDDNYVFDSFRRSNICSEYQPTWLG